MATLRTTAPVDKLRTVRNGVGITLSRNGARELEYLGDTYSTVLSNDNKGYDETNFSLFLADFDQLIARVRLFTLGPGTRS